MTANILNSSQQELGHARRSHPSVLHLTEDKIVEKYGNNQKVFIQASKA